MKPLANMEYFQHEKGKSDQDVTIAELRAKFVGNVSRLPIINADEKPKYLIHESRIDKYLASGGSEGDTLETFVTKQKKAGFEF